MKRVLALFLVLILLCCMMGVSFAEEGVVKINEGSNPNVRSLPSSDGEIVGKAKSGTLYDLLDTFNNGWYKIRLENGTIGWISGKMATVIDQSILDAANKPDQTNAPAEDTTTASIQDSNVFPGTQAAIESSSVNDQILVAPTEEFIIERLSYVPDIAYIAAATESHDPNGLLGKQGGYTAQIYFSSPLVNPAYAKNSGLDIIEAGTDCGGSIEVYSNIEDAMQRNIYLSMFDGTVFSTGSHTVIGSIVIRTSSMLTASEQTKLESEIIQALTEPDSEALQTIPRNEPLSAEELITVTEAGFQVKKNYLYYAFKAHSNLSDKVILYPEFRIVSRDANGGLISASTQVLMILYPGQEVIYAGLAGSVDEIPSSISVEYVEPDDDWHIVNPSSVDNDQYIPLEISSAKLKSSKLYANIVGEIYNPNTYNIASVAVTVVFKDENGKFLAGQTTYVNGAKAGKYLPFEISISKDLSTESFEIFAQPW